MKNTIEIIFAVLTIIGVIYQISKVEQTIYNAIDIVKDAANDRLHRLEARIDVMSQKQSDRTEHEDYLFHAIDQKIDHKFNRLYSHQKDIEKYLRTKFEYRVREYFGEDEQPK